jgi:hypothetical protein
VVSMVDIIVKIELRVFTARYRACWSYIQSVSGTEKSSPVGPKNVRSETRSTKWLYLSATLGGLVAGMVLANSN